MRVACLQLAPRLGAIEDNVAGAERLVGSLVPGNVDLLVLPEMAFSGGWLSEIFLQLWSHFSYVSKWLSGVEAEATGRHIMSDFV